MQVFRLEKQQVDGSWTGPYRAVHTSAAEQALRDQMWFEHVKLPCVLPQPNPDHFAGAHRHTCACPSQQSLQRWFGHYLQAFLDCGWSIGVYEVPEEAIAEQNEFQIVYRQDLAQLIYRIPI